MTPEHQRLAEANAGTKPWRKFGPYVAERQWGTVREDYSAHGDAWTFTTHDQARSRAYRWGEEALAGFCDEQQLLCFGLGLWNGQDAILKERLFGLSSPEGNHGEDVKEVYYYLDATPTHSYQRMLYKYPQHAFPYEWLVNENARRDRSKPEFELMDTAMFLESRYFDVFVEFAKADAEDILIQLTVVNRGPDNTTLHLLPQLWFRNTWAWGNDAYRPLLSATPEGHVFVEHKDLGALTLYCDEQPELLFCENATNNGRLYNSPSEEQFFKDGVNDYLLHGQADAINPNRLGTKAAAHYELVIGPNATHVVRLRLAAPGLAQPFADFNQILSQRQAESDQFYQVLQGEQPNADIRNVQRQAYAGMLWSKQYYYYDVSQWLAGDPALPPPPPERLKGRNATGWAHLNNSQVISMPDKWEYPWYAAWDLAFHCLPLAHLDMHFAKSQLILLCRDWYMHPNGQLPAYEWKLADVNPPVHAYAAWRVFKIDQKARGDAGDVVFLETIFHRLLLNFTWWVNRKDREGHNIFEGGFLGLDNIGVFDRSAPLPFGGYLEQADGTAWVAMYALNMMRIALQLSQTNPVYQDLASKFFEHFLYIANAMTKVGQDAVDLWDENDEFYYDALNTPDGGHELLKVRSMVGLIPLFAVEVLDTAQLAGAPQFLARMNWFLDNRPELAALVSRWREPGQGERHLLSLLRGHRVKRLLARMLDESEFLSPYGVRSLSRYHASHPFVFRGTETQFTVNYEPAESQTSLFGGNSNWRGPIWMPMNFMLIESLQRFHHYYGDDFKVEYPTNSGQLHTLLEIANSLTTRLTRLFLRDPDTGRRACFGDDKQLQTDPHFRDYLWFHEYFHADNGHGLGASHQTGWTGLIAKLLQPRHNES